MSDAYANLGTLFPRLRADARAEWDGYVRHPFVRALAAGTLPEAAFRHYLGQDYLFLIHFARAYALAAYKAETLDDIRAAAAAMSAIVDVEMGLHVQFCAAWGLSEAEMQALPEDPQVMAYTRYVLEAGNAGDLLDLHVALAPCVIGYGEIGLALADDPETRRASSSGGNPYAPWIDMYAGDEYQEVARAAVTQLDDLFARRGGEARYPRLLTTFRQATVLEQGFWQMGLDAG